MQTVSTEDNLHEMSNLFSGDYKKKYFNIIYCLLKILPGMLSLNTEYSLFFFLFVLFYFKVYFICLFKTCARSLKKRSMPSTKTVKNTCFTSLPSTVRHSFGFLNYDLCNNKKEKYQSICAEYCGKKISANSEDPDQTLQIAAYDQGLHCLPLNYCAFDILWKDVFCLAFYSE